jgi:hypothetical protein
MRQVQTQSADSQTAYIVIDPVRAPMLTRKDIVGQIELPPCDQAIERLSLVVAQEALQDIPVRNDTRTRDAVGIGLLIQQPRAQV